MKLWQQSKAVRSKFLAEKNALKKQIKDHIDSVNWAKKLLAHHEYKLKCAQDELSKIERQYIDNL